MPRSVSQDISSNPNVFTISNYVISYSSTAFPLSTTDFLINDCARANIFNSAGGRCGPSDIVASPMVLDISSGCVEASSNPHRFTIGAGFEMTQTCNDIEVFEASCFSGDEIVNTLIGGDIYPIAISRVLPGQLVQVSSALGEIYFSEVIVVPHPQLNRERAVFLEVTTEDENSIILTPDHILPVGCAGLKSSKTVRASAIESGVHCLITIEGPKLVKSVYRRDGHGVNTVVK